MTVASAGCGDREREVPAPRASVLFTAGRLRARQRRDPPSGWPLVRPASHVCINSYRKGNRMNELQVAIGVGLAGSGIVAVEVGEQVNVLVSYADGINEVRHVLPMPPREGRVIAIGTAGPALILQTSEGAEAWIWVANSGAALSRGRWHAAGR